MPLNAAHRTALRRGIDPNRNLECSNRVPTLRPKPNAASSESWRNLFQQEIGDCLGEGHDRSHDGNGVVIMDRVPSRHLFSNHLEHLCLASPYQHGLSQSTFNAGSIEFRADALTAGLRHQASSIIRNQNVAINQARD